jgi:hypothetical protein
MRRNRTVSTAIAIAFVAGATGRARRGGAGRRHLADGPDGRNAGPSQRRGRAEQNRSGGKFSPSGVPTKNQSACMDHRRRASGTKVLLWKLWMHRNLPFRD